MKIVVEKIKTVLLTEIVEFMIFDNILSPYGRKGKTSAKYTKKKVRNVIFNGDKKKYKFLM